MNLTKAILIAKNDRSVVFLILLFFAALVSRGQGMLPTVFADEWHYSLLARLLPLSQSDDPGFIYLGLYRLTNLCGIGYLGCARELNALFFVGGCFLIFQTARLFLSASLSLGVTLLALLAPESIYALFFMPETLYFFVFWVFVYIALHAIRNGPLSNKVLALAGLVLAVASLVKPHALFLVAGFSCYLIIPRQSAISESIVRRLSQVALFVAVFLSVKFLVGYLFVGMSGITLFGTRYSTMASQNITADRVLELITNTGYVLGNHVTLAMVIFFIPFLGALRLLTKHGDDNTDPAHRDLSLFLFCVIIPLLMVTAAFSASVAGTNPYDVIGRVHMRYYNFSFPLLIIMAAVVGSREHGVPSKGFRWLAAVAVLVFMLGALRAAGSLGNLEINFVDSPLLMFMTQAKWARLTLLALGLFVAIFSIFRFRAASQLYLFAFLPLVLILDAQAIQNTVEARKKPDVYDIAGLSSSLLLSSRPDARVVAFGPDEANLYKTSFYLDRVTTAIRVVSSGRAIDPQLVPMESTHVLIIGGGTLENSGPEVVSGDGFRLISARKND